MLWVASQLVISQQMLIRGWSHPVNSLGEEKSYDEIVSTWFYKCLSSYSCFIHRAGLRDWGLAGGCWVKKENLQEAVCFFCQSQEGRFLDKQLWCGNLWVGLWADPGIGWKLGFVYVSWEKDCKSPRVKRTWQLSVRKGIKLQGLYGHEINAWNFSALNQLLWYKILLWGWS